MRVKVDLPIDTISEANKREHWAVKAHRVKKQRRDAWYFCRIQAKDFKVHDGNNVEVELTRNAPKRLDDDNLCSALKAVRDGIADFLKIDDGSPRIKWVYRQEKIPKTKNVVAVLKLMPASAGQPTIS